MAAPSRHDRPPPDRPSAAGLGDRLGPARTRDRIRLGWLVFTLGLLAVLLGAAAAPREVRGPVVLAAATLLPGYPLVARLPVDLASLLALQVCVSLALEAAGAFLLVQIRFWHPQAFGLTVVGLGVAGTLVVLRLLGQERP